MAGSNAALALVGIGAAAAIGIAMATKKGEPASVDPSAGSHPEPEARHPSDAPQTPQTLLKGAEAAEDPKNLIPIAKKLQAHGEHKAAKAVLIKASSPLKERAAKKVFAKTLILEKKKNPEAPLSVHREVAAKKVQEVQSSRLKLRKILLNADPRKSSWWSRLFKRHHRADGHPGSKDHPLAKTTTAGETITSSDDHPLSSPIDGVTDEQWKAFVKVSIVASPSFRSPTGELGMFLFSPRRLQDLGLMTNVHRESDENGKPRWTGTWILFDEEVFRASPALQTDIFRKGMAQYAAQIRSRSSVFDRLRRIPMQGKMVKVSLSGLLAVAHRAGWEGMKGWLGDESVRIKFQGTTRAFLKANGIFA